MYVRRFIFSLKVRAQAVKMSMVIHASDCACKSQVTYQYQNQKL
jgi:hypothetical protein